MTDIEIQAAIALERCTFLPGSFDKQWCHQLGNWYSRRMTQKGRAMLIKMVIKYRRQIKDYEAIKHGLAKETAENLVTAFTGDAVKE